MDVLIRLALVRRVINSPCSIATMDIQARTPPVRVFFVHRAASRPSPPANFPSAYAHVTKRQTGVAGCHRIDNLFRQNAGPRLRRIKTTESPHPQEKS